MLAAYRLLGLVRLELNDGRGADSLIRKCAAIVERTLAIDDPGRIESDLALALLARDAGSTDTTLFASVVERTGRAFGPSHLLVAARLEPYSSLHRGAARFARAQQLLARAHAIYRNALGPDNLLTAKALNMIGVNHVWSARSDLALPYFEQSFATIRELVGPDHIEMIKPSLDLGDARRRLGDPAAGMPLLEHAVGIAGRELSEERWLAALARLTLGTGYLEAGRARQARPILERVLAIYVRTRPAGSWDIGRVMDLVAQTGGEPKRVREYCEGAARIYLETFGPDHPKGGRAFGLLSTYRFIDGDTLGAISLRDSSIAVATRTLGPDCPDVAWGLLALGRMYGACGRYDGAVRSLEQSASAFARGTGPGSPQAAMSLRELGVWQAAAGRPAEAFHTASRAEAIRRDHLIFNARAMPESEALDLLRSYPMTQGVGLNLMLSLASGPLSSELDTRREAWDALIRSRAMVLNEMGMRHRSWAGGADPDVVVLAARFDSASRQFSSLELRGAEPGRSEEYRMRLDQARLDRSRAERALVSRSTSSREAASRDRMGLESVMASLPAGAGLVAFVRYERVEIRDGMPIATPAYLAFVLGGDRVPAIVPLGEGTRIDSLVARWRNELEWSGIRREGTPMAERRYRQVAAQLRRVAWDPVTSRLGGVNRVFVVPDGSIGLVNLVTLPVGSSEYLIERGPSIHYLSAERDLALGTESGPSGQGLLAIGAPEFDAIPAPSSAAAPDGPMAANGYRGPRADCITFGEVRFGALPGSGQEVETIADLWRAIPPQPSPSSEPRAMTADVLTGAQASESGFRAHASGHRVVHLATHGFFVHGECQVPVEEARGIGGMMPAAVPSPTPSSAGENPLRLSGLALSGANLRAQALAHQDDGILTAEEIASMDLTGVQWAVLSACDTGVGEYRTGEGLMGFRRAFHIAGARTTIMSLWRVRDRAVARWMEALYENRWRRRLDTAESVRAASLLELRARRDAGLTSHPAHWGAFIAMGDWR